MKLKTDVDKVKLEVLTTNKKVKTMYLPKMNIHFWYPFNVNFYYKFTDSKNFLYLVKEKGYEGNNYYNIDILKRTKQLAQRNGVMFHPGVYKRNKYIIEKARAIGIPTIQDIYTAEDIEVGFNVLSDCMAALKDRVEERFMSDVGEGMFVQFLPSEEWDAEVYSHMTEEEQEALIELGEMYSMLNVMRKLTEAR
jgi:hypothetical protein